MRNESIIGSIIACPKCGSMVEVTSPEGSLEESTTADSPVIEANSLGSELTGTSTGFLTWVAVTTAVGLMLVGGLALWLSSKEQPPAVAKVFVDPKQESVAPSPQAEETQTDSEPAATESIVAEPEIPEVEVVVPAVETPESETTNGQPVQPETPPVVEPVAEASESEPAPAPVVPAEPVDGPMFNALDLDPESLQLGTLYQRPGKEPEQPAIEVPPKPQQSNVLEPQMSTLPIARRGAVPEDGVSTRNAQEQFLLQLPSLEVQELPLVSFLQLMSQISGVPVSITAGELQLAGISARKRVSLQARDVTLHDALTKVLRPLKLKINYRGPQVIIAHQTAEETSEIEYVVTDLNSGKEEAELLVTWIKQLVIPNSWNSGKIEHSDGKLQVTQNQRVHVQLLLFLERLRLVRGLEPRSKFPVAKYAPTPLQAAMAPRLARSTLFTFTQETPVSEVFQHWQRELGVPLLVDWSALAEVDLWPDATIACAVGERSWQQALTDVLEPLGLDWRVCFGGGIEISTAGQFRDNRQLELYRLAGEQPVDGQQLIDELRRHLASTPQGAFNQDHAVLVLDQQSPAIIALQDPAAQRETLRWLIDRRLFSAR